MKKLSLVLPARILNVIAIKTGLRNARNRWRYGKDAPIAEMRLKIEPACLKFKYHVKGNGGLRIHSWRSGEVADGDWDLAVQPFVKTIKFRSCRRHFLKGVPWTETEAWPYGLKRIADLGKYDDCRSESDLAERYARLDDLWEIVKKNNTFPDQAHRKTTARTGILVHIDRNGDLLFGNKGFHRVSIAKLQKIPELVVVVGLTHPDALGTDAYKRLMLQQIK